MSYVFLYSLQSSAEGYSLLKELFGWKKWTKFFFNSNEVFEISTKKFGFRGTPSFFVFS